MLVFLSLFLTAALAVIDQLLKILVVLQVKPQGTVTVIKGLLSWHYSENTGAAFGMMSNSRWFFIVVTAILMVACLYLLCTKYRNSVPAAFIFALILSGGIGNMIDRVANGFVVDYIYVSFFPAIFNFADCCVVVGAFLAIFALIYTDARAAKAQKTAQKAAQDAEPQNDPPSDEI